MCLLCSSQTTSPSERGLSALAALGLLSKDLTLTNAALAEIKKHPDFGIFYLSLNFLAGIQFSFSYVPDDKSAELSLPSPKHLKSVIVCSLFFSSLNIRKHSVFRGLFPRAPFVPVFIPFYISHIRFRCSVFCYFLRIQFRYSVFCIPLFSAVYPRDPSLPLIFVIYIFSRRNLYFCCLSLMNKCFPVLNNVNNFIISEHLRKIQMVTRK